MQLPSIEFFPPGVAEKLNYYVYRLFDPRNGETFYIGKGNKDRVFAHIRAAQNMEDDSVGNKLQRIIEIRNSGFEVGHVIHRHGMDEATSLHVECALIDAYPGLLNEIGGHGSSDFGPMHSREIIQHYAAEKADFSDCKVLLISVNRSATSQDRYEATRFAWKIDIKKAAKADVILATQQGMIRGAYVAKKWLPATAENFPGRSDVPKRYGFHGHEAGDEIKSRFLNKAVPEEYRRKGASNPIKYTWH